MSYPQLLADIGGTNARFALETAPGTLDAIVILACADYPTLSDALRAYFLHPLAVTANVNAVQQAGIAIANPVQGDTIQMTNHHWSFSIEAVRREFQFKTLHVINDFKALAMALPFLSPGQKFQIGGNAPASGAVLGLLGAGTGLGVSGLIPSENRWIALDSEGGHVSFSPTNEREIIILQFALKKYGHVSSERFLSGAGLQLMYQAFAAHGNHEQDEIDAPEICRRGLAHECPVCLEVLECFCELLGSVASNLAVTLGARGGIHIGGGIVPRLGSFFMNSGFRQRFEQKGRLSSYMQQIPVFVITEPYPAFIGIPALIAQN